MSRLFKASLLLTIFFGVDKIVALIRQSIIVRQFGLSAQIDAFNAANNIPDLVAMLISGGTLALAFIPLLTESIAHKGEKESWKLFSIVANLVFLTTAVLSILAAIFSHQLIASQFGIAPGFTPSQQLLTQHLMQLNLIATLIFSISGLTMGALQAHKHFLLPAIAPILYNLGQIFGAIFLVPIFGVYGLTFGVILGAVLHLGIQIPGMFRYGFSWYSSINLNYPGVKKCLNLIGPRIVTVLLIQLMFLTRDNLASRLGEGSVSALTYAYFIMQVPETLIGTAIATALLPTLAELSAGSKLAEFSRLLGQTIEVIISLTVITSTLLTLSLQFFVKPLFNFNIEHSNLLIWTSFGYLIGLLGQSLLEVLVRAFYARHNAKTPLVVTSLRTIIFIILALILPQFLGVVGLALTDSIAVTVEAGILLFLLQKSLPNFLHLNQTIVRTVLGSIISIAVAYFILSISPFPILPSAIIAFSLGGCLSLIFIKKELRLLLKLK